LFGTGVVTDGIGGVGTLGVWIGASGTGSGVGVGLGTVIVGTLSVGNVGVETVGVGTETVGTEIVVGTVSAGLEWGRTSRPSIVATSMPARAAGAALRAQALARIVSRQRTPLQPPVIGQRGTHA
jgi:hypothetical protein